MKNQKTETVTQQQEAVMKQKNPRRIEQGKRLVEYNCHKKEELKWLNEQTTKQDGIKYKPKHDTNTYVLCQHSQCVWISNQWLPSV